MQQHKINNTQRIITAMKLNQSFLLIQYLYMGILRKISVLLLLLLNAKAPHNLKASVTMIQRRVSILHFPSLKQNCLI